MQDCNLLKLCSVIDMVLFNLKVRKEKSIYHTLNMLSIDVTKKCLVAEGWSPTFATKQVVCLHCMDVLMGWLWSNMNIFWTWFVQIQDALQRATFDSNSQVGAIFQVLHTIESPPTYFRTNKFTSAFQEIVDAYGLVPLRLFLLLLY